jgi:hypothetical protein
LIAKELQEWLVLQQRAALSVSTWCALDLKDNVENRKSRMLAIAVKRTTSSESMLFCEIHDAEAVSVENIRDTFKSMDLDPEWELAELDVEYRARLGGIGAARILLYEVGPHENRSAQEALGSVSVADLFQTHPDARLVHRGHA